MSIEKISFIQNGTCDICKEKISTLIIDVVAPGGEYNIDTDIEICKKCFNDIYKNKRIVKVNW